jgi:hypothetical protein
MVIGYNPHLTPNPTPTHVRAPQGSQFLPLPTATNSSHYHHHYRKSSASHTTEEDDDISLESSDTGSGSFSSHDSTSERRQPFTRSYSGHTSSSHPMPQLKSRDAPCGLHDITPQSHDRELAPPPLGDDDYTSKIRYPNNSRIHVTPLLGEDLTLKEGSVKNSDVRGAGNEPFYCDRSRFDLHQQFYQPQQKRQGTSV